MYIVEGIDKWRLFRLIMRVLLIAIICYSSIQINYLTVTCILIFLTTYYIPNRQSSYQPSYSSPLPRRVSLKSSNSFSACLDLLPKDQQYEHLKRLAEFLLSEDPSHAESLYHFDSLKRNSECSFARKSRLWGSGKWYTNLSIQENVSSLLPLFFLFTDMCNYLHLDGFVVALPVESTANYESFKSTVEAILSHMAKSDPDGLNCMGAGGKLMNQRNWKFIFNNISFFISGFAPFYPETHSRYSFEIKDYSFLLFQPTTSFDQRNLPPNHVETNFESPQDVRDHIRKSFTNANRVYLTDFGKNYKPFEDIVKPLNV